MDIYEVVFFLAPIANPPIKAMTVPPCATTRNLIIFCDMATLPLLKETNPYERASTVPKQPDV